MLVYNTTDTFGTPASQSYNIGNAISGGGTVLYVGTGTAFTHSGLEDGKNYYYRLYTKTNSSYTWSSPLKLKGHTKTKSIKSFPYTEDFESGVLDEGWRQEYIQGNYDWCVKKAWNVTSYVLLYDTQNIDHGTHDVTRAVMPTFDFSGHNNAILEFDYRNWVRDMSVVYRTSPDEQWQLLSKLNNHYILGTSATTTDAKNSEEHVFLDLPDITNEYEIAFVADFSWRGDSRSSLEMGTIDNIKVSIDFGAFTETKKASKVSSTFAEVEFLCYEGTETISSKGIEWSTNQSSWTKVSATENNQIVKLTSLPSSTTIYYRSYVQTNKSTYVGTTLSFKTLEVGNGSGTEDDPFLIASATAWGKLVSAVNSGNDMAGIYYALSGSFTLTPVAITKEFNGHLDGQGNTITMTSNSGVSLMNQLGANGVVENLNVVCNSYSTPSSNFNTPFVLNNYGLITKCSSRIESLNLKNNKNSAGICNKNFGTISYCDSYIYLPIEQTYNYGSSSSPCQARVGGICWYNSGLIDHCSFDGDMSCNNNSHLGGIAATNWYQTDEIRGHITNCINFGTLRIILVNSKSWAASIGGITGSSYGPVEYCVNEGRMVGECNSSDCLVGGIIGGTSTGSSMSHCLNRGVIEVNPINASAIIGGIIGYNDRTSTQYSVNTGNFTITGTKTSYCNAVAGDHRNATMTGCYYDCNITDSKATKVTSWETTIQTLNTAAGFECWKLKSGKPYLSWEKEGEEEPEPAIIASGTCGIDGDNLMWILKTDGVITISGKGQMMDYKYDYPWADYKKMITKVVLEDGVTSVCSYAFSGCSALSEVNLPNTLEKLGQSAFQYNSQLTEVYLPSSICNFDEYVFANCSLKRVVIEDGLTTIGAYAFSECSSLEDCDFPNSLIKIGDCAFQRCRLFAPVLPTNIEYIGTGVFESCASKEYNIPASTTYIGHNPFYGSSVLEKITVDSNNKKFISIDGVLYNREKTKIIACPQFVSTVILPITIDTIGSYTFCGCTNLEYVKISSKTTTIQDFAFYNCSSLKSIKCYNPVPPNINYRSPFYKVSSTCLLYVPAGSISEYKNSWTMFSNILALDSGEQEPDNPEQPEEQEEPDAPEEPYTHPDYSTKDLIVYAEDFTAPRGKTVDIPVLMNNSEDIVGYQYDLYLPEGITIASDEDGELIFNGSRTSSRYPHTLEWKQQSDGSMRILSYSAKGTVFTGTSGDITQITLQIADSVEADSSYIAIKNIVLSKTDGSTVEKPVSYAIVRLKPKYTRGDVNDDGKINVVDISCIASLILGNESENLIPEAADANLDGKINVGDISSVAGFILNGSFVSAQNASNAGTYLYSELTMPDMVMTAGKEQAGVLYLTNPNEVYSLQFDLCLPDGITIKQEDDDYSISQVKGSSMGHTLDWAVQEDGSLRIINFSATNKCFADNQNGVLNVEFVADEAANEGNYEIILKNIVLTGANGTMELADKVVPLHVSPEAAGIADVKSTDSHLDIYSINGVRKSTVSSGLNIVNSKKIFVKK